jgi:hypothetical protein
MNAALYAQTRLPRLSTHNSYIRTAVAAATTQ